METSRLWLFFLMVLGVVVLPGLDMAFVVARSLVDGRRAGLFAVAGLVVGGIVHVTAGALGFGALLGLVPALFNAMLLAGAFYIAWIAFGLLRQPRTSPSAAGPAVDEPATASMTARATFRQAAVTNLLNPKAYLFMVAICPQFLAVGSDAPPVWRQAVVLGAIISATQAVVYGALAIAAGSTRNWLGAKPAAAAVLAKVVGVSLLAAAIYTGIEGWRRW